MSVAGISAQVPMSPTSLPKKATVEACYDRLRQCPTDKHAHRPDTCIAGGGYQSLLGCNVRFGGCTSKRRNFQCRLRIAAVAACLRAPGPRVEPGWGAAGEPGEGVCGLCHSCPPPPRPPCGSAPAKVTAGKPLLRRRRKVVGRQGGVLRVPCVCIWIGAHVFLPLV